MDDCEEVSEHGYGIEIIDYKDLPTILRFDNTLSDEIDIFDMTSLSTLVFLSQRDSNECQSVCNEDEKRLTLAYERLSSFPKTLLEQFAPTIHTLDISYNEFENLNFLKEFTHLTTLICDHNNVTSSTLIPDMPNLQILWLNYCKITELYPWARYLRHACPKLKYLSLMGNIAAPSYLNGGSFYEYLQYRLFMISLFPSLDHLDDRQVSDEQRQEEQRMYRWPLLDRLSTKSNQVLPAYLSTVSDKLTNLFQPNAAPFVATNNKNIIG
ncbi:Misexpression suppressor of KSR 4 [Carabus blaptoides fortunei]